ncbi:MAG: ABC transporter permease [Treponema sp.]|nr:ABC transporter permease [Treponema sp.]MCL2230167.1 ABC transporter permease [Treponema sp.]
MENVFSFLKGTVTIMLPIFFASLGGLFPAICGALNIALEGLILISAFSSLAVFYFTGNIFLAVISAIFAALVFSILHSYAAFKLKTNLFISGLAINLFSSGLCIILSDKIFKTKGVVAVENSGSVTHIYIFIALFLLAASWIAIYKTPFGYRLRACDKNRDALVSLGINPKIYQTSAILISGVFCGIGGSFLSLNLGAYVPEMSAGKGWIALAVIFLGMRRPFGVLAGAFVFALAECFSNYAQGFWSIPSGFILAIPYICTLAALIIASIIPKK